MLRDGILAFDIGGTTSCIALFDGNKFLQVSLPTPNTGDFKQDLDILIRWYDSISFPQNLPVFVASAPLLCNEGVVKKWANRPYWVGHNLYDAFSALFKTSSVVEIKDDCNLAAYGAHRIKNNSQSSIYINVGTGVGMGIIFFDRIYTGENNFAGELGHITIDPFSKKKCACGKIGCLQVFLSDKYFKYSIQDNKGLLENLQPQMLISEAANMLGCIISNIVNVLDINTIFLGGGVFKNNLFFTDVCTSLLRFENKYLKRPLNIYNCTFSNWSLIGAAIYGWDYISSTTCTKESLDQIFRNEIKQWS